MTVQKQKSVFYTAVSKDDISEVTVVRAKVKEITVDFIVSSQPDGSRIRQNQLQRLQIGLISTQKRQ